MSGVIQMRMGEPSAQRRIVPVYLVDATDGQTPETGVVMAAGEGKVTKADGSTANAAGTLTEIARGLYTYTFTAAELNIAGFISFDFSDAGARTKEPVVVQVMPPATYGTVQVGSTQTAIILESGASAVDDYYNDMFILISGGPGAGLSQPIFNYVGATRTVTPKNPFDVTPNGSSTYVIGVVPF